MLNLILEILAVITAIIYLVLAAKLNVKCWYAAIISSLIFFYIYTDAKLIMEAYLQIFYIVMSIYGWIQWKKHKSNSIKFTIMRWSKYKHFAAISFIIFISLISKELLNKYTNAEFAFIDSVTSWGAVVTTYMVAKKIIENWFYWFVIDSILVGLFIFKGLYFTAALFVIYLFIIIIGYKSWKEKLISAHD